MKKMKIVTIEVSRESDGDVATSRRLKFDAPANNKDEAAGAVLLAAIRTCKDFGFSQSTIQEAVERSFVIAFS